VFFAERVGVETGRKVHTEASDEYSEICDALRTLLNVGRGFEAEKWPEGIEDERKSCLVFCPEILCTFSAIWRDGGFNYFSNCGGRIGPRVSHYCNLPRNPEGAPTTLFAESVDEAS
jgi:hypothetical protein